MPSIFDFDHPRGLNECRLTPMPAISEFGRQSLGSEQLRDVAVAFCVKTCVAEADWSVPITRLADACETVAVAGTSACETFCRRNDSIDNAVKSYMYKRLLKPRFRECMEATKDSGI